MGTLYLVATPIGNLDDITLRALKVLRGAAVIAAEDTRRTRGLLTHFDIHTRLISYHAHNEQARVGVLLDALAAGDVALVTDAGMPGISDPGATLVAAAHAAGHRVSPIPGASALTAAVAASGLVVGPFIFLGFLPRSGPERRAAIGRAGATGMACVLFESPQRLGATLADLAAAWGDRPAAMARELTKMHETIRVSSLAAMAGEPPGEQRGEIVLVVGATGDSENATVREDIPQILRSLREAGLAPSAAAREAAALTGRPRSELYALARSLETPHPSPAGMPASGGAPVSIARGPGPAGRSRGRKGPD